MAIVSLHPYVNAVVAVTLGWLVYREPFGVREALAMIIIFIGRRGGETVFAEADRGLIAAYQFRAKRSAGHAEES